MCVRKVAQRDPAHYRGMLLPHRVASQIITDASGTSTCGLCELHDYLQRRRVLAALHRGAGQEDSARALACVCARQSIHSYLRND
jgi:hypothetical protein